MADRACLATLLVAACAACSHAGAGRPPAPETLDPALLSPDARIEQSLDLELVHASTGEDLDVGESSTIQHLAGFA